MTAMKSAGGKWTSAKGLVLWLGLAGVATTGWAARPAGPVAEWNFDERSTVDGKGDMARDSSGHGHTAQLHGPVWVKHGKGFVIGLDGFDDYVDCGNSVDLGLGGPVTLEAWVQSNRKAHGEAKLLGEEYSTYVMTYYNGEQVYWYISSGGNNIRGRLSLHQWYHVAASFDGQQMRMWVNGQQVASKESDIKEYQPKGRFHIGAQGGPKSPKFKGMVDRVRIYNRPFSDDEALQHFQAEKDEYLDLTWAGRVKVTPYFYRDRQQLVVECDYKGLQPLQGVGRLLVTLASKENPAEILQQIQIDRVSAKAGLAEVTLPWGDLAAGNYVVRATLTDDHGAYPVEQFDFSCPINAPPLVGPADKQVAPLPVAQRLTPFQVQMGAGGGFTVTVDSQSYPFESRISWPHGDFNRLWAREKPASGSEKQWHVEVREVPPEDVVHKKRSQKSGHQPRPTDPIPGTRRWRLLYARPPGRGFPHPCLRERPIHQYDRRGSWTADLQRNTGQAGAGEKVFSFRLRPSWASAGRVHRLLSFGFFYRCQYSNRDRTDRRRLRSAGCTLRRLGRRLRRGNRKVRAGGRGVLHA